MRLDSGTRPSAVAHERRQYGLSTEARLLRRVLGIGLYHCPNCGGGLKIIVAILESTVIAGMVTHLGLQAERGRGTAPANAGAGT